MEKFGLFDLIEKFNSAETGKKNFAGGNQNTITPAKNETADNIVGAPPQLVMNAKMRDFIARHDELVKAIKTKETTIKPPKDKTSPAINPAPKKRGRPKKSSSPAPTGKA